MSSFELHWADLAFASKKPLRELNATFIAAPRELSVARFTQLIKQYLPSGNLVVGCAEEAYVPGFEGQAQFKTLQYAHVEKVIKKVNDSANQHKITVLHYSLRDTPAIYDKIQFRSVILINGSWQYSFHTRPEYYALVSHKVPFEFISPFVDENEARAYVESIEQPQLTVKVGGSKSEMTMMQVAAEAATYSFDSAFQTGVVLAAQHEDKYTLLASAYNKVVPYQTFAWHHGASRERHLSPPGDLNHYDAVHAEVMLIIEAQKRKIDLNGTTLFINLLPCPTCARMLCATDIREVVYSLDHSNGYAVAMLEASGKTVRRIVNITDML